MSSAPTVTTSESTTRAKKVCSVEGCVRVHVAKGYCSTHYNKRRRHRPEKCVVQGCGESMHARRLCSRHYQRVRNHGSPNTTLYRTERDGVPSGGLSEEFCWWLAGFSDGESAFCITHTTSYRLKLRGDDVGVLELIQDSLNVGSIGHRSGGSDRSRGIRSADSYEYSVYGVSCLRVVEALDGKMRSKKNEDFEVWAEAVRWSVELNEGKPHPDRKPKMLEYKKKLEEIRDKEKWKGPVGDGGSEG